MDTRVATESARKLVREALPERDTVERVAGDANEIATDVGRKAAKRVREALPERDTVERVANDANEIAIDVSRRAAKAGSRMADKLGDVAAVITEEGVDLMKHAAEQKKSKKGRKHRIRNASFLVGLGATAGYFLDPSQGKQRRDAVARRFSKSAQVVGDGLSEAADLAHHAADASAPEPPADLRGPNSDLRGPNSAI